MNGPSYKRRAEDRQLSFHRPHHACYACNDTGITSNSDGLVSEVLSDYDRLPDGRRLSGSDLPLICHCAAAFPTYEGEKASRGGFREASGQIRRVDGTRAVGAEIPKSLTRELHQRRLANWRPTEQAMSEARRARAAGQADARPWFLVELRAAMEQPATQWQTPEWQPPQALRDGIASAPGRLQSIGGCLAQVVAGASGILEAERYPAGAERPLQ